MEIIIDVPKYESSTGIRSTWESGFEIEVKNEKGVTTILANKAGLISLATQLLTMAQDNVPTFVHLHYDEFSCLETGSSELIIGQK